LAVVASREDSADDNPFSSRYVRPGAIPFLFDADLSAESLVARLRDAGWRGEVIGPHGAGKSSLVQTLLPALQVAGRKPELIQLHAGARRLPASWRELAALPAGAVIVVDGYEQLSRWTRFRLARLCAKSGYGLVVTSHTPMGLPTLYEFGVRRAAAHAVVEWLLRDRRVSANPITASDIDEAFDACGGNIRETLFRLYDVYERRRC
jgi:hypothetical protein